MLLKLQPRLLHVSMKQYCLQREQMQCHDCWQQGPQQQQPLVINTGTPYSFKLKASLSNPNSGWRLLAPHAVTLVVHCEVQADCSHPTIEPHICRHRHSKLWSQSGCQSGETLSSENLCNKPRWLFVCRVTRFCRGSLHTPSHMLLSSSSSKHSSRSATCSQCTSSKGRGRQVEQPPLQCCP